MASVFVTIDVKSCHMKQGCNLVGLGLCNQNQNSKWRRILSEGDGTVLWQRKMPISLIMILDCGVDGLCLRNYLCEKLFYETGL